MNARTALLSLSVSLAVASSASAMTLEERDVVRFSEDAIGTVMTHSFVDTQKTMSEMRSAFATETAYEGFAEELDRHTIPMVKDQLFLMSPSDMTVTTVEKASELGDRKEWKVSGTVSVDYTGSQSVIEAPMAFEMKIAETQAGYGVQQIIMTNAN